MVPKGNCVRLQGKGNVDVCATGLNFSIISFDRCQTYIYFHTPYFTFTICYGLALKILLTAPLISTTSTNSSGVGLEV